MDLSRYASRLSSAQRSETPATAAQFMMKREDARISVGATRAPGKIGSASVRLSKGFPEAEDAGLTGGTRSLSRRLLGLNLNGSLARPETRSKFNAA